MKLSSFVEAGIYGLVARGAREPKGFEWHPPVAGRDVRSPCTGLNNLANHGFLPRSGKNIDIETLRVAVKAAFNYDPETFDFAFKQAVDFNLTTTGNPQTFNLDDLAKHDAIEFDGSLSRNDFYFGGNNNHFNPAIWASTAKYLKLYDYGPHKKDRYITVEAAAKARAARVKDAMKVNPAFNASEAQQMGSPGTTALYLTTMWDVDAGAAPKAWVRSFFEKERIPYLLGYKKSPKNSKSIGDMFEAIASVEV
ncbi:Chloroperoxidase [Cercophora newfieldiana]|uniref:Chloroperoxidase n=1 Tax=Cercophora newfieldiana TaxID=92897 RepID=A0AA40CTA9_9PEZI|nr:Chloroperoxidase [Cercophora newfieldiana]